MSVITEILDRLSRIEVVKEKLRDTGVRVEQLAERMIDQDRQLHDVDRRLVRIEAFAEIARTRQGGPARVSAAGEAKTREGRRRATEQSPTHSGRTLASGSKEGE